MKPANELPFTTKKKDDKRRRALAGGARHTKNLKNKNQLDVTRNDDEISASPRNRGTYMILFEQNCNNLKMATIGRNM